MTTQQPEWETYTPKMEPTPYIRAIRRASSRYIGVSLFECPGNIWLMGLYLPYTFTFELMAEFTSEDSAKMAYSMVEDIK